MPNGAVLWQAHAGALWHRFTLAMRQELAAQMGLSRRTFGKEVRVSFAKVAEYQRRGLVHFHAVIRLDGPAGEPRKPLPYGPTTTYLYGRSRLRWPASVSPHPKVISDSGS